MAGGAKRTARRGSLLVEMGTIGGRAGSQTTCSGILGERGSAVKGLKAVQVQAKRREHRKERDDRGRAHQCGRRIEM